MRSRVSQDYINSREHKMILLLKLFRRGLNISCREVGEAIYFSGTYIRYLENTQAVIDTTKLVPYANFIAEKMNFDAKKFYLSMKNEMEKLEAINRNTLLNSVFQVINENTQWNERGEVNISMKDENQSFHAIQILSYYRRMLNLSIAEIEKRTDGKKIGIKEVGIQKPSPSLIREYAICIGEEMRYKNKEMFFLDIMQEALFIDEYDDPLKNALKAIGRVHVMNK